ALVVAEFHQRSLLPERFDDGADLSARQPSLRHVAKQRDHIQHRRTVIVCAFCHHNTQQVTNRGTRSAVRTIHSVLTTARLPCRSTGTSTRHRLPYSSDSSSTASAWANVFRIVSRSHDESLRSRPSDSQNTRALCRPRGCDGSRQ